MRDLIPNSLTKRIFLKAGACLALSTALGLVVHHLSLPAQAGSGVTTHWVDGHASRVRMMVGRGTAQAGKTQKIVAGIQIELRPGWKTYWRHPGDAGGVPPNFDWSKSTNVAEARVVFPAPKRLTDETGDTIGYKDNVVLPVVITPSDAARPIDLKLDFTFGVCREICIPAEARLALDVPHGVSLAMPDELSEALEHAPRTTGRKRAGDPEVVGQEIVLTGSAPRIVLDVDFAGAADKGDVFAEAPDGIYLPMARRVESGGNDGAGERARFVIDLRDAFEFDELKGRTITLTLVGTKGQSERELRLQ